MERLVARQDREHLAERGVTDAPERHAVRRRADRLEHQVRQQDGVHALRARVQPVEQRGDAAHGLHSTAEVPQEPRQELAVPAFLVAVHPERLGELRIALREAPRQRVRLREPRLLRSVRGVEELQSGAALLVGRKIDGVTEVHHVVRAALGATLQSGKPPCRGAIGDAGHPRLAMAAIQKPPNALSGESQSARSAERKTSRRKGTRMTRRSRRHDANAARRDEFAAARDHFADVLRASNRVKTSCSFAPQRFFPPAPGGARAPAGSTDCKIRRARGLPAG